MTNLILYNQGSTSKTIQLTEILLESYTDTVIYQNYIKGSQVSMNWQEVHIIHRHWTRYMSM